MQVTFRTIKALQILRHKNNMLNRKRDTSNIPKAYVINLSLLQVQIRNLKNCIILSIESERVYLELSELVSYVCISQHLCVLWLI